MPLIGARSRAVEPAPPTPPAAPLEDLTADDPERRRRAAQVLADQPEAVAALAAQLAEEPVAQVRQAIASSLVRIGDAAAARSLAELIAGSQAALRCVALDSLKQMGGRAIDAVDGLLTDRNPDVRLQAVEVMRVWPAGEACARLWRLLNVETEVNVCAAALDVAAEVGTADLVPVLQALASRFAHETFLRFAIDVTIARIRTADGHAG